MSLACLECGGDLVHEDTLGNLDHCLEAIGHPRGAYSPPRRPVKTGDVWRCESCSSCYHTLDGEDVLHSGYP